MGDDTHEGVEQTSLVRLFFLADEDEATARGVNEEVPTEDHDTHTEELASVDIHERDLVLLLVEQRPLGGLEAGGLGVVVHPLKAQVWFW
jgi:hypothetical protein